MAKVKLHRREVERGLPRVCMCCGEEAATERRRSFSWYPPWVNALLLVGVLPAAIVASMLTKKMTVHVPLCRDHQNHWGNRNLIIWGGLFGLVAVGILAFALGAVVNSGKRNNDGGVVFGFICLGMSLLFIGWLIIVSISQSSAIRPVEITDDTITLSKVSQGFIDALDKKEEEWESRPMRRPREDDENEYFDPGERWLRPWPRDGFRAPDDRN